MNPDFDDLIVGCGSAGAVLAARLSEDPDRRVAVLESGPDYSNSPELPGDLANGNQMSLHDHDWGLEADILRGRSVRLPRGRVTGGSSAVGATIALRGMPSDFDEWAAWGNPSWSWEQVLPFFKKLELDLNYGENDVHGGSGPIPIRRWLEDEMGPWQTAFLESCADRGYAPASDHNDPYASGYGPIPSNRRDQRQRVSTAQAYLTPARGRGNLTVLPDATVGRLLISYDRVTGVETTSGQTLTAKRVILAAGAINSPVILLRSGIGDTDNLKALGIDTVRDLPGVGQNLIDHPRSGIFIVPSDGTLDLAQPFLQGILRTTSKDSPTVNDMQYYMVNHFSLEPFPHLRQLSEATWINGVMVCQQRPKSRGQVRLNNADIAVAPEVDLNFLSHPDDITTMIAGIRECRHLMEHDYVLANRERQLILRDDALGDDDLLRIYLKATLDSSYHPVGTARMGPESDPDTVVDEHGQVHGIAGLYVCDASIMPNIASANTNLTTIMIGEKMADDLTRS